MGDLEKWVFGRDVKALRGGERNLVWTSEKQAFDEP